MKKSIILSAIVISSLLFSSAQAQIKLNVNINIGDQPTWVANQDAADYYYLPDIDCYYDVKERVYVYREVNVWRRSPSLPPKYKNYDFRNKHAISIKGQDKPYLHHDQNKQKYMKADKQFTKKHGQQNNQDRGNNQPGNGRHNGNRP
jgi:hypothetical protein